MAKLLPGGIRDVCRTLGMRAEEEIDLEGNGEGYSGTFRWKKSKILPSMPSIEPHDCLNLTEGWMEYFLSREPTLEEAQELITKVSQDLSLIDCLSTPVTIASLLQQYLSIHRTNFRPIDIIHILCIGTSSKTEGRILNETNCFHEISNNFPFVPQIQLYLVGPEMDSTSSSPTQLASNLSVSTFQGTSIQFFRSNSSLLNEQTIVIGLNCGYGNWENPLPRRYDLCFQWLPDLYFLTATQLPLYFTCANDYADLVGEVSLHELVFGSYFILPPAENKFAYASTLVPPNATNSTEYSRGNSYIYGVRGSDKQRRKTITPGDVNGLQLALKSSKLVPCKDLAPPTSSFANTIPENGANAFGSEIKDAHPPFEHNLPSPQVDPLETPPVETATEIFTIHRSISHSVLEIKLQLQPNVAIEDIQFDLPKTQDFFRITHMKDPAKPQIFDIPINPSIDLSSLKTKYHRSTHTLLISVKIT